MTETRILVTGSQMAPEAGELLSRKKARVHYVKAYTPPDEISEIVKREEIEAIIVRACDITREVLAASPCLKVVVKHGTGVDNIDIKAAADLKIPVLRVPYANQQSVAEHTVALMYSLTKNIPNLDRRLKEGHWDKFQNKAVELSEKNLGLVGFGRIGRLVAQLVKPLGMKVGAFDPYVQNWPPDVDSFSNLMALLSTADIVSLHCPLTAGTKALIGEEQLKAMKPGAYIINTARGGLIDEGALVTALKEGWIAGAGLDTFSQEPPSKDNPLFNFSNVILTPHVGGSTNESSNRTGVGAVETVYAVIEGRDIPPDHVVNPLGLEIT